MTIKDFVKKAKSDDEIKWIGSQVGCDLLDLIWIKEVDLEKMGNYEVNSIGSVGVEVEGVRGRSAEFTVAGKWDRVIDEDM